MSSPSTTNELRRDELVTLGALAETLIPADDTPGADAAWATSFVARRMRDRPGEQLRFRALATHLDTLARAQHGQPFAQLSVPAREALLLASHPSLADGAALDPDVRALRTTMREMIAAFLSADGFEAHEDPYGLRTDLPRRDRRLPSTPDYSTTDSIPDVVFDRRAATWVGTGTYARVWLAAGYAPPPGQPQDPDDAVQPPDGLVTLRSPKPADK